MLIFPTFTPLTALPSFLMPERHLRMSTLVLFMSRLGRTELLELRLLRARCSDGSEGRRPLDFANRLRMSVRDTTPVRRPERRAPGSVEAGTDDRLWPGRGDCGPDEVVDVGIITVGGALAPTDNG